MDMEKLATLVAKKHGVRFDVHDPLFVMVTLNEEMQKQNTAETSKIIADGTDQVAAMVAQMSDSVGRQIDRTSEATTERAAAAIRLASQDAVDHFIEIVEAQVRRADRAAIVAVCAAIAAGIAVAWATWPLWVPGLARLIG